MINNILDSNIDDKVISNSTIVYVRVSTVSQIDGNSLDYQQKLGIEFFENSDIKFDSIIVLREEGKSGDDYNETNFVERPLLRYINSKIDSGIINHFWIYDLSRLSRNSKLSHILFKQFKDNNVNLYVLNERKKVDDISDKNYQKVTGIPIRKDMYEGDNLEELKKMQVDQFTDNIYGIFT